MDRVCVKSVQDCRVAVADCIRLGWLCDSDRTDCLCCMNEATTIEECQRIVNKYSLRLKFELLA